MESQKPLQTETRLQTERHIARRTSAIGFRIGVIALVGLLTGALLRGQTNNAPSGRDDRDGRYRAYDELLDLNVRDGMVYYRTLKAQRARLDAYVSGLASASIASERRGSTDRLLAECLQCHRLADGHRSLSHYATDTRLSCAKHPAGSGSIRADDRIVSPGER